MGIGGYDDFESYSEGPLSGDWEERISSGWWTFSNYGGDMCLKHEASVNNRRSMVLTDQWGVISDSLVQAKIVNVGVDSMAYVCSRVGLEKNTVLGNCDFYACRNDLRDGRNVRIVEYDDGVFSYVSGPSGNVEGVVYQKFMTVTDGAYTDMYAKVWDVSGVEPGWQLAVTDEVTNGGAEDGCFALFGYTDDVFYVSDFWLIGGYSAGGHVTEWRDAGESVGWSVFNYSADGVSVGSQDVLITVEVSDDGGSVLDSLSFDAVSGVHEVDISGLSQARFVRVVSDFSTSDLTKTAEVCSFSVGYQLPSPEVVFVSNPYPSDGSTGVSLTPMLHVDVNNSHGELMNVTWSYYDGDVGSWYCFGVNDSVVNGTYYQVLLNASNYETTYLWSVNCTAGVFWVNVS